MEISFDSLRVELSDGRCSEVPLAWFPRLLHGNAVERRNWRLIGGGQGIHWSDLDEDIKVSDLLAGLRPSESEQSLARWLGGRDSVR